MAMQSRTNITNYPFIGGLLSLVREAETILQDASRTAVLACYTLMGKVLAVAGTVVAGTNSGNGTVTAFALAKGVIPIIGNWVLECTGIGGTATTTMTAGTVTAGTNTGNGTPGTCTAGSAAIAGTYRLTCITEVGAGGVFKVVDPNGDRIDDLTVAVAYSNNHFSLTIADGAEDFNIGDTFTIVMTPASVYNHGGTFKLTDPKGNIVRNDIVITDGAGAAKTFYTNGMVFTITDGSADFEIGDTFTLPVAASGKWLPFNPSAVNGLQIPRGIYLGGEIAAATIVAADVASQPILVGGCCTIDENQLVIENSATLATVIDGNKTVRDALHELGIFPMATTDIDELENS